MQIQILDDFDLKKIADSGQCFRVREMEDGLFRFVTQNHILYIKKVSSEDANDAATYEASCDENEWKDIWKAYFDFDRNYSQLRQNIPACDLYMRNASVCGSGIRILSQDPWEMLISFIISQRKSIPAIKSSIELICEKFGRKIQTEHEQLYLFPSAQEIVEKVSQEGGCASYALRDDLFTLLEQSALRDCKLGYRLKYICDAICRVIFKEIDLLMCDDLESQELLLELKQIFGVGDKVANCIALFAYGRCELAPVDTWIRKVIEGEYGGMNPFPVYGEVAGIMQQYIFYYAQTHKREF